ncbi:hypothetical protein K3172_12910 [Qipengyuania sp. 6B39]|uniref:hypothetical protein n=1 Tax=Qipengyuania proteolytica TaxID=2867239 RepID=UPI001C88FAD6|nr:hypothetical protein [Qipengyuania proteolytica]MBX7496759.1 hypothetical protein [Qipengyuania proteolytica]
MALGDVIARLAVNLSLETAAFEKGADLAAKQFEQTRRSFEKTGKRIQSIGIKMSAAITAPLAGIGVALAKTTKDLVESSREMKVAAQVAGEGFEDFQRLAYGAKTVGIEADKLGDIFKDVQDKVGDFRATGGGGMADFFENIAPKVGVTAEAFKGLGGKDALQLYYDSLVKANVSSDEMRFYMEAIASDATNLIPLLENGGKAFDEFGQSAAVVSEGDAAQLEEYAAAGRKLENAWQKLAIAVVSSGLLEAITNIVTKLAEWANWISEVNPEILNWAVGIGAVLAALGPLVTAVGAAISVGSGFLTFLSMLAPAIGLVSKALLLLLANPIILGAAAVIAGIYLAWKNWDKIGPIVQQLYQSVKTWLMDKLGAVLNWVTDKVKKVEQGFAWLYDRVVGNSWVPDMVTEIGQEMAKLDALMVKPVEKATKKADEAFRTLAGNVRTILDRLFPEIARLNAMREDLATIDAGEKAGLISGGTAQEARFRASGGGREQTVSGALLNTGPLVGQLKTVSEVLGETADRTKVQTVRIAESFKDMAEKATNAIRDLVGAIKGGDFFDILGAAVNAFAQLAGAGVFGGGLQAKANSVPAYAGGTNFHPGGLAMVGERGPELVSMPRGSKVFSNRDSMAMGGGKLQVEVVANNGGFGAMVRNEAGVVVASAAPSMIEASSASALGKLGKIRDRSLVPF